jgi:hypothetical protein
LGLSAPVAPIFMVKIVPTLKLEQVSESSAYPMKWSSNSAPPSNNPLGKPFLKNKVKKIKTQGCFGRHTPVSSRSRFAKEKGEGREWIKKRQFC